MKVELILIGVFEIGNIESALGRQVQVLHRNIRQDPHSGSGSRSLVRITCTSDLHH